MRSKIHFFMAIVIFISFALTGLYMRLGYHHIEVTDIAHRMMYRANHIYILFASLLNFSMCFFKKSNQRKFEIISSVFVLIATISLVISFFIDPKSGDIQRDISRFSIIGLFIGYLLQILILQYDAYKISKN